MSNKYDEMQIIVNWDRNPETEKGARQVIHSTISRQLPVGDYNVYVGKVIDKIAFNQYNQLVFTIRKPREDDLSPENLNRQPLTANIQEEITESEPETIRDTTNRAEILEMKQAMINAEKEFQRKQEG